MVGLAGISAGQSIINPGQPTNNPNQINVTTGWLYLNKMSYQGAWSVSTTYNSQDLVTYSGSSYVSLAPGNAGNTPSGASLYWAQLPGGGGSMTWPASAGIAVYAGGSAWGNSIAQGNSGQYVRGDFTLATFPTNLNQFSNGPGYITGNQSITWTASGDASGSASGATSISPALTITGLQGKALPSLAAGLLRYSGSAWAFDNSTYLTANQSITVSGDCSGSGTVSISLTCTKIQGNAVKSGTPSNGNVLTWVTANSDWEPTAPTGGWSAPPVGTLYLQDDFLPYTGTGQLSWRECCGTYSNISAASTTVGHPGVRQMQTGSTSGNTSSELLNTTGTAPFFSLGTNSEFTAGWNSRFVYLIDSGSVNGAVSADSTWICVGFNAISATSCTSGDSIMVYAASSAPITCTSGSWVAADMMFVVVSGSTRQCIDTGIAASTSTWYDVLFQSTTLGTVSATVNGTLCAGCTVSANVPTTTVSPQFMVYTQTTASKTLWADYFQFVGMGLSR